MTISNTIKLIVNGKVSNLGILGILEITKFTLPTKTYDQSKMIAIMEIK